MKKNNSKLLIFTMLSVAIILSIFSVAATQSAVNLRTAGNFIILAKSGISTTGATSIVGDIGVSPIDSTAITGFGLIMDSSNKFATSSLITGKVYAADYTSSTPTIMTTAISDMETAYADANGRTDINIITELGAGNIGGMTLSPGLYKWSTGVIIPTDVTLSGNSNDIWIFQISGTLDIASGKQVLLSGGAQAKNIFWQVADTTTLGTTSVFNGNILDIKAIVLNTGAVLHGRALTQTAVTLDANIISLPTSSSSTSVLPDVENSENNDNSPIANTPLVSTDSNQDSGISHQSNTNSLNNEDSGIGQELSQQIADKRIEYTSGNFTTSLGQFLNVRELASGFRELREDNVIVKTKLKLIKVIENNKSKLEVELSKDKKVEIKIMPSTASATALVKLKLKVCNETNNCIIELKQVGIGKDIKLVYQMKAQKNVKVLGLFKAKMNVETNIDAETGKVINEHKPWWAFLAKEEGK